MLRISPFCPQFSLRFSFQFNTVCIINQAVQNSICKSGVRDATMPIRNGDLTGDQGGGISKAVIKDLKCCYPQSSEFHPRAPDVTSIKLWLSSGTNCAHPRLNLPASRSTADRTHILGFTDDLACNLAQANGVTMKNSHNQPHKVLNPCLPLLRAQITNSLNPSTIDLVDRQLQIQVFPTIIQKRTDMVRFCMIVCSLL